MWPGLGKGGGGGISGMARAVREVSAGGKGGSVEERKWEQCRGEASAVEECRRSAWVKLPSEQEGKTKSISSKNC